MIETGPRSAAEALLQSRLRRGGCPTCEAGWQHVGLDPEHAVAYALCDRGHAWAAEVAFGEVVFTPTRRLDVEPVA